MVSNSETPISSSLIREEPRDSKSSPYNQPKTEISPLPSKGKQKTKNETRCTNSCENCLSCERKSIKGYNDTCDNLEFATEQIVGVPAGDQAYHHYENVATGHQDSYAAIQCNVCHNKSNQSLLLLCDLCASSSHTYCVGLGDTVPEDDWICKGCTLLMDEHAEEDKDLDAVGLSAIDPHSGNQNRWQNYQNITSAEAHASILDIVRGSGPYNVQGSLSNQSRSASTNAHDDITGIAAAKVKHNSQAEYLVGHHRNQFGGRRVLRCRNRDSRIRALRENWEKIRQGSLSFSSFPISKPGELSCGTSSALESSTSNIIPDHATHDIKKAWKIMNVAKSIDKKKDTNTGPCSSNGSKHPLTDTKTPKGIPSVRSMLLSSRHSGDKHQDCKKFKRPFHDSATEICNDKRKFHRSLQKEHPSTVQNFERHPVTYSLETSKLSTTKKEKYPVQGGIDHESSVNLLPNNSPGTFSNNAIKNHHSSTCCGGAGPVAESHSAAKLNVHASSSSNRSKVTNGEKHHVDGKAEVDSDAKSEIQTLVKLNLKLLTTKKKLDTNEFKEVARLATHSILAACGIGTPKSWVRSLPNPYCSHAGKVEQVRRSTLMPSSCRECFLVFVKDAVNAILLEKTS